MMIAPHSRACKEGKKSRRLGEYRRIWGEEEGNADFEWYNPVGNMLHHV